MEVHRGEVFYADLSPVVGSEQGGVRPVFKTRNVTKNILSFWLCNSFSRAFASRP